MHGFALALSLDCMTGFSQRSGSKPLKLGELRWPWWAWLAASSMLILASSPQWWPKGAWPSHIDDLYWYVPLVDRAWHEGNLLEWLFNSTREAGVLSLNLAFAFWVGLWPNLPALWTFTSVGLWLLTSRAWQRLALQSQLSVSESLAFMFFSVSLASVADVWIWPMAIQHLGPVLLGLWAFTLVLRNFPSWSFPQIFVVGLLLSALRPSFLLFVAGAWTCLMLSPGVSLSQRRRASGFLWATSAYTILTLGTPAAGWQVTQFFSALGLPYLLDAEVLRSHAGMMALGAWLLIGGGLYLALHRGPEQRDLITWPSTWTKTQELLLMGLFAILLISVGRWQLSPASLIGLAITHAVWPFTEAHPEALRWAQIPGPLPDWLQIAVGVSASVAAFRWTLRRESKVTLLVFLGLLLPVAAQSLYLSSLSEWPWKIPWLDPVHVPSRYLVYIWPVALFISLVLAQAYVSSERLRKSLWTILAVLNLVATWTRSAEYASRTEGEFQLKQLSELGDQINRVSQSASGVYCSSFSQIPVKVSVARAARGLPDAEKLFSRIDDPFHPVTYTLRRELRARGCEGEVKLSHDTGDFEIPD